MNKVISRSPIFKGLTEDEVADILKETPHSIRSYSKGQTIAQRTEEVKNLSIIIEGSVKGEMVDFSGKILKIEEMFAPKPIAHAFLFGENNKFPVDVIALEDCKLLHIPKIEFLNLMQKNSKVLTNYLNTISNRAQFLSNKLWFLSFKTIKEKIAHYLLNLSKSETRTTIILPKSHQELAEFFGVTRPSLARVLSELQDDGIIHVNRREVTIINKKKLLELIN
ncbi:MAG: family transcriptional regulator, dissimilatory nitrate respiration regulator [Tenuifilum sp.]|jgi:CRP-like cAMP-binding protein|uniref:Crp/Fnr family transcriptional regulator n=1 Tax=Tenuifilum sp. TaxID=2760880 RepID=UPI0024AB9E21|nr:Crp/Fnr family transcriptional regulator [Tenuifilum sp.]MDI3527751.1 family transcriptional regulator, dissimilatory nitrate respiration regulator [Tenuifilum sp.]